MADIVLASASPRRRVLLAMLGLAVEVKPADIDEAAIAQGLAPGAAVLEVARAKVAAIDDARIVLAADTLVVCQGQVLGKPADRVDARDMLRFQSGQNVRVLSGVAVRSRDGQIHTAEAASTLAVTVLAEGDIDSYLETGEADDKAGGLAVQGAAKPLTSLRSGSRSNVYGLPLTETIGLLLAAGIPVEQPHAGAL
jgi:septum formation protein